PRVPGVAVFPHPNKETTPLALRANVDHNHVLHRTVLIVSVLTANVPHVPHARAHDEGEDDRADDEPERGGSDRADVVELRLRDRGPDLHGDHRGESEEWCRDPVHRYAGTRADADNIALLLQNLEGVLERTAAFVCAAAFVTPEGEEHVVEAVWNGEVLTELLHVSKAVVGH
ncbi:KUP/HAK/KT family potassium transporter, partial [Bacillus sp. S34]|nr:KUP/HAK/KT family potassium transporter [Bacillus sp. S34]